LPEDEAGSIPEPAFLKLFPKRTRKQMMVTKPCLPVIQRQKEKVHFLPLLHQEPSMTASQTPAGNFRAPR
jgi:hypothetical protein